MKVRARTIAYRVLNGHTLGYIDSRSPGWFNVLRGGFDEKNGPVAIGGASSHLRPATAADFAAFRVSPKGHIA